jgi:GNAT superfamily N-acetyltransferase
VVDHESSDAARIRIRAANAADVEQIHAMIVQLATYEQSADQVTGTAEQLAGSLFGAHPSAEALIVEDDGAIAGFALFYTSFSTWECLPGIWLEDLFVRPEHRRAGVGRLLLTELARIAIARGCTRLEWNALDWNELALGFYERLGATRLPEWDLHRLAGSALRRVADGVAPGS